MLSVVIHGQELVKRRYSSSTRWFYYSCFNLSKGTTKMDETLSKYAKKNISKIYLCSMIFIEKRVCFAFLLRKIVKNEKSSKRFTIFI